MQFSVFSDESYITAERYRSIAAFSFPNKYFGEIDSSLKHILKESDVKEFKWQKLRNAKYRLCAEKLLHYILDNHLFDKKIRIDVLIWDTHDSRHSIQGRDDISNFERMFFHLLKNVMTKRGKNTIWNIFPDEKHEIDWFTVNECLANVGKWREIFRDRLFGDAISEQFYQINTFKQITSIDEPCCQIADMFAGLAVFSKKSYSKYNDWCSNNDPQLCLFEPDSKPSFTNKENERFEILNNFVLKCNSKRLGVSINSKECLCTFDPNNPINFWHYVPQHSLDKAPIRNG